MAEGMSRDTATKANYFSRNPDELRRREESVGMFRINDIIQHVKKDVGKAEFFKPTEFIINYDVILTFGNK